MLLAADQQDHIPQQGFGAVQVSIACLCVVPDLTNSTSMVVPVYFCYFSSATLITSFILYQGLKASAVSLITMVLGFLTTCLGITLLQMSKVDPKSLSTLDRKSTILLQASRQHTEEAEKGHVTALEDPGMDALRGGFGAVGSVIRARSVSRRMSNASSLGHGGGPLYDAHGNLSTHGLGNVQRFQRESASSWRR